MVAKCASDKPLEWDSKLPYLLFAYCSSAQELTRESPFYLVHGRDPRIPTETVLSQKRSVYSVNLDDYKVELASNLSEAWELARENILVAQEQQKTQYNKKSRTIDLKVGDRVMVFNPGELHGKDKKIIRPYYGPYRILTLTPTNAEVKLIEDPMADPIFVARERIRLCYPEQGTATWTGRRRKRPRRRQERLEIEPNSSSQDVLRAGPVTRSMSKNS